MKIDLTDLQVGGKVNLVFTGSKLTEIRVISG
jgi:hypothetical protein